MELNSTDRSAAEARFAEVFANLGHIAAYARRRGARDPDGIAAEAMAIAWRRLGQVPVDDARPWLFGVARNLLKAERRGEPATRVQTLDGVEVASADPPLMAGLELDPELEAALRELSESDREALLLVACEDLTPAMAARSLGISQTAFRVRLHRARRRLSDRLTGRPVAHALTTPEPEWSR
jgi:RNA polymerase sigma-70 factor, ECF subfamily